MAKSLNEAVIVSAVRSPMGRARKGSFIRIRIDDVGAAVVREAVKRVEGLDPKEIEDVMVGCAMPEGEQGMNVARIVGLLAGIPDTTAATTVNRFCGSSLQTIDMAAQAVMTGNGDVFVAAGIETMTHVPMGGFNPSLNDKFFGGEFPAAYIPMGLTAENLAEKYSVSREEQDQFALESHQKAVRAIKGGSFKREIVPIEALDADGKKRTVDTDEGPREDTNLEALAKLKAVFKANGTVTAGNSSPLTDGAAATVIMSATRAKSLGAKPIARIRSMAVAGCPPEIMGIGPVEATRKALDRAGLRLDDMDAIELNEAFAAQSLPVIKELGIDRAKLNQRGGAIALGHPLGCSGARLMTTLLHVLEDIDGRLGLATMCIGGGQGIATIVERG